jgi:GMP synthase-like glutamine amidotransferase
MRVHVIQHVSYEGPGAITQWAAERGHEITTSLALTEEFPPAGEVDFLVVMGGPMAVDDHAGYPWLQAEKRYLATAIAGGRIVLGICLGAQILAEVLGGAVRRNEHREIGWFEVECTPSCDDDALFEDWVGPVTVGQWHGDTFELAVGIPQVLSSPACRNQAFVFDGRVVGLQFHLEWTPEALALLLAECAEELTDAGPYVMTAEQIAEGAAKHLAAGRERLFALLDGLTGIGVGEAGDGGL